MITADDAEAEWIADGVSITRVVLLGDEEAASRMVRNVFDAHEFRNAIALVARLEVARLNDKLARLNDKLARYCCQNGEALGLRGREERQFFIDPTHAALHGQQCGRLVACRECVAEVCKALANGHDDPEYSA